MILRQVSSYISARGLLRPDAPVIVAVSGGADSVALLDILLQLGYRCTAAHCNFHLRGEESNRDMHHVEALADRLGIDLYVKDFDVASRRRETGESLEMACRELRYAWFADLLDRERAQAVAVAHHREDQAETLLLNLLRGSGITGLGGMRPRRGHVVRPLLECSRADIEEYLRGRGIGWVDDSTNAGCDYARNRVRNRLMPLIAEIAPGAESAMLRAMEHLRETDGFVHRCAADILARHTAPDGSVDLRALAADPHAAYVLYESLRPEGYNRSQTDDMLRAATAGSAAIFHAPGSSQAREIDHGMLRPPAADMESETDAVDIDPRRDISGPVHIAVTVLPVAAFRPERDPSVMYLDASALEGTHRWQLRHPRRGDRMQPFGMTGTRLLSDIYAGARLSAADKRRAWLLTRDGEILWAVGIRASARFALGPDTCKFVKLEILPQ